MEVRLAEYSGFCFGVKRAVDTVNEQIKNGKNIYTYGPIVHNEEVVKELSRKGVRVIESREELLQLSSETMSQAGVIIRAHGVPEEIYHILEEKNLECIDATCPFVARIQKKVEQESTEGCHIVIVGNAGHPEVEGIIGWCKGPVTVLGDIAEAEQFQLSE